MLQANILGNEYILQMLHGCDRPLSFPGRAGEVPWVSRTIRKYHDEAAGKRVKIVHMCGFDSIPSDLGAHMVATAMFKKHKKCAHC